MLADTGRRAGGRKTPPGGPAADGTVRPPERRRFRPPRWLGSLRVRTTLVVVAVLAVTLAAGGAGLVWLVHRSLVDGMVGEATAEAQAVAGVVSSGNVPSPLPERSGVAVQVVNAGGTVVAASPALAGTAAVSGDRPAVGRSDVLFVPPALIPAHDQDQDLAVAMTVGSPSGPLTVYAVSSTQNVEHSTHLLALVLAGVLPALVVVAGVLEWLILGRTLRPVEDIRREVAAITAEDLHRRVPEPPSEDEIGRLAQTMNEMLERLERATERQRQFVSDASHELRSPLAAVLTQLEVARSHPDRAHWPAVSAAVVEETQRLSRIVDDLLLLARSDEGALVNPRRPVDLDDIVLAEGARLRDRGHVRTDLHGVGAGRVLGDRDQLTRAVRNLLDNAERHAASQVTLSLRQTADPPTVELEVADDGPGIPADQRLRVFERFARVDTGRGRPTGGTGLGLAIVGELVTAHGGRVWVADSDVGTRMIVQLPPAP